MEIPLQSEASSNIHFQILITWLNAGKALSKIFERVIVA